MPTAGIAREMVIFLYSYQCSNDTGALDNLLYRSIITGSIHIAMLMLQHEDRQKHDREGNKTGFYELRIYLLIN